MQDVQEKEVAHQDPSELVLSRHPSTVSRVTERLALLKNVFVRSRTPRQAGTITDQPYRKISMFFFSHLQLFAIIFQMVLHFLKKKTASYHKIN